MKRSMRRSGTIQVSATPMKTATESHGTKNAAANATM